MIELNFKPEEVDWDKGDGLVPVVIQDATSLQVLMLGYMDRAALAARESGGVTARSPGGPDRPPGRWPDRFR